MSDNQAAIFKKAYEHQFALWLDAENDLAEADKMLMSLWDKYKDPVIKEYFDKVGIPYV